MRLLEHPLYQQEIESVAARCLPWEELQGKVILLSGATGMVGHFLIDVLQYRNREYGQNCTVYVLGRSEEKARACFAEYWDSPHFFFLPCDLKAGIPEIRVDRVDYLLHLASTTHPKAYATEPIDTIMLNVLGLHHMLEFARQRETKRVLFTSSCEIYGSSDGGTGYFTEESFGYIDCNTLRAGYPESKRAGEALCQAYIHQWGLDIVIARLSRTFGPTMLPSDSKAVAQFIKKAVDREDIALKSAGGQLYSYSQTADAVAGLLYCLLLGGCGEAYNIATDSISLKGLANIAAEAVGRQVVFELPDEVEKAGYSTADISVLDTQKLRTLGWTPHCDLARGIRETVQILSDIR